jgi:hypothetical protein
MPKDLVSRINLSQLYLPFLSHALELLAKARDQGHDYVAVSGYRSYEEQANKYAQGRTKIGKIITNAQPGFSLHQYGLAIDVCLDKDLQTPGLQPEWDNSKGQYEPLWKANMDSNWGLLVGVPSVPGGDPGHIQINCVECFGMQEMALLFNCKREYLKAHTLKDVWAWLDSKLKPL